MIIVRNLYLDYPWSPIDSSVRGLPKLHSLPSFELKFHLSDISTTSTRPGVRSFSGLLNTSTRWLLPSLFNSRCLLQLPLHPCQSIQYDPSLLTFHQAKPLPRTAIVSQKILSSPSLLVLVFQHATEDNLGLRIIPHLLMIHVAILINSLQPAILPLHLRLPQAHLHMLKVNFQVR